MLGENFDYFVTPIAFDVSVNMESPLFEVERIYASPGNELPSKKGECVKMISLFPSAKEEPTTTKGGVVLVKLLPKMEMKESEVVLNVVTTYFDEENKKHSQQEPVKFSLPASSEHYANNSVRKAIILSRYVNLMKHWIRDTSTSSTRPRISRDSGILVPAVVPPKATNHSKMVTPHYRELFQLFMKYLENQSDDLKDDKLVSDLEEKLNSIVSSISFGDIQMVFQEMKKNVVEGNGMPFTQVVTTIKSKVHGTPNDQQLDQLKQLIESEVYNSSDPIFEKFVKANLKGICVGYSSAEIETFLKNSLSDSIFGYLQPHVQRVSVRIQNHTSLKVLYDLFKKHSSEKAVEKEVGAELTPEMKSFLTYVQKNPTADAEKCIRKSSREYVFG